MAISDYDDFLSAVGQALKNGNRSELRTILDTLDSRAFLSGLNTHISARKGNQPGVVEDKVKALMRLAEAHEGYLDTDSKIIIGIGGGGAASLVVGGVLLIATPPIALLFAGAGILFAGISYFGAKDIDGDKLLYHQIADALREIGKALP